MAKTMSARKSKSTKNGKGKKRSMMKSAKISAKARTRSMKRKARKPAKDLLQTAQKSISEIGHVLSKNYESTARNLKEARRTFERKSKDDTVASAVVAAGAKLLGTSRANR